MPRFALLLSCALFVLATPALARPDVYATIAMDTNVTVFDDDGAISLQARCTGGSTHYFRIYIHNDTASTVTLVYNDGSIATIAADALSDYSAPLGRTPSAYPAFGGHVYLSFVVDNTGKRYEVDIWGTVASESTCVFDGTVDVRRVLYPQ